MGYVISKAYQQVFAAIALVLLGVGVEHIITGTQQEETFDIYTYKIDTNPGIAQMMQTVINNPTQANIEAAHYNLGLEGDWAYRKHEDRARAYETYLEACNDVLISLSNQNHPDLQTKIATMNEKKELI
jgi:hypothetical protein